MEASGRAVGDVAILRFKGRNTKSAVCFSFYFHMYGNDVDEIGLYSRGKRAWRMVGNQGDVWRKAEITITGDYDVSYYGVLIDLAFIFVCNPYSMMKILSGIGWQNDQTLVDHRQNYFGPKQNCSLSFCFQLVFIASVGNSFQSDIAIDDMSVSDGQCGGVPTIPPNTAPPSQEPPINPG